MKNESKDDLHTFNHQLLKCYEILDKKYNTSNPEFLTHFVKAKEE